MPGPCGLIIVDPTAALYILAGLVAIVLLQIVLRR